MTHLRKETLAEAYREACEGQSDINEHCPRLRELASQCLSVTEFGVRSGVSSVALLAGALEAGGRLDSYDIAPCAEAVARLEEWGGKQFAFHLGDSLTVAIPTTDLLFIDTVHTGAHLYAELRRHAWRVLSRIALHDTQEFAVLGDDGGEGMALALGRFLADEKGAWRLLEHRRNQHGLTVLERR